MHINWVWDTDRAPDPTHPADFVILALVCIAVIFFFVAQALMFLRYKTTSVRSRRAWSLQLMILGSVTHIVAEYVTNAHIGHFTVFDTVRTFHCTFWDYWLKYGLGFNLWQVAQAGRLFAWFVTLELKTREVANTTSSYSVRVGDGDGNRKNQQHSAGDSANSTNGGGAEDHQVTVTLVETSHQAVAQDVVEESDRMITGVNPLDSFGIASGVENNRTQKRCCNTYCLCGGCFSAVYYALHKRRFGILILGMCILLGVPGILLCASVEITHSVQYSELYRWCVTHSQYVYATVVWLIVCVAILLILLWRMRKYDVRDSTSYRATRDSTVIGVFCLIVLIVANRFEVSVTWWGRCLQTTLVVILYVFSFLRLNWGMFRDAFVYGLWKENPHTREEILSDIEFVLSGDQSEPTWRGVQLARQTRSFFISIVQKLPLWSLPSSFNSNMDRALLTPHFAAQCVVSRSSDGKIHTMRSTAAGAQNPPSSSTGMTYVIDDDDDNFGNEGGDTSDSHRTSSSSYEFRHPIGDTSTDITSHDSLNMNDFEHVPLKDTNIDVHDLVQQVHNSTFTVCPAEVWDLYCMYSGYVRDVTDGNLRGAVMKLREILTAHFRIEDPDPCVVLQNDGAVVTNNDVPPPAAAAIVYSHVVHGVDNSQPNTNTTSTAGSSGTSSFGNHARGNALTASSIALASVGAVNFLAGNYPTSTPTTLSTSPATLYVSRDGGSANMTHRPLLLDRWTQPTTPVFARFFEINSPTTSSGSSSSASKPTTTNLPSETCVNITITRCGIHTLPVSDNHLRQMYVAAARCNEDLDMNDPLDCVQWMCDFLLGEVWLPYCTQNVKDFARYYKTERRKMALSVAMADELTSAPQMLRPTVV